MPDPDTTGTPPAATPETPVVGTTAVNPPAPSVSGGKSAQEWETAYKGLQGTYQKLKEGSDKTIGDLTSQLREANENIQELTQGGTSKDNQMDTLLKQIEDLNNNIKTLEGEKSVVEATVSRSKLVMAEFPELATWEAQGLLPVGETEEDTRAALQKFHETLTGQVGVGVKKVMGGATPVGSGKTNMTPAPDTSAESEDFVWSKMMDTAGKDEKAYTEWRDKYDAIQLAKKA